MGATDIYIPKPSCKNRYITLNKNSQISIKENGIQKQVIAEKCTNDFDAVLCPDGRIHIFAVNSSGALCHICCSGDDITSKVLLETKGNDKKICHIRVVRINSKLHLFYCLSGNDILLVHQIIGYNDYGIKPNVVDRIGKKCAYSLAVDDKDNIHIVFATQDRKLKYIKYIYNRKTYSAPIEIAEYEASEINCVIFSDALYTTFVASAGNRMNIYVHCMTSGAIETAAVNVHPSAQLSVFPTDDRICLGWKENGMLFSVTCSQSLVISRVNITGKCNTMARLGICSAKHQFCTFGVSSSGLPYGDIITEIEERNPHDGYEVEGMARKYKEVLGNHGANDFKNDLTMIEASLERLIKLVETALEKSVIKLSDEYNVEEIKEEAASDE